jgi:serine/threonine-protein kinase
VTAPHRFGPFWLDERLAVGGTAEVYLARPVDPASGLPERLVVKRLLPHFAEDMDGRTMFEREARLHAAVTHENVVTVFHAGKEDTTDEPYLAMEYIEGVDGYRLLRRLRQEDVTLPASVSVYIAREVLRALESVHAARDPNGTSLGIVHRDVSPSNIYVGKAGAVKLGDFGIARSTTRTSLRSESGHVLKGKFAYLAPEQVAGEGSDHRADLFSLATVLAEMLLNRPLFLGGGQLAILLAIRDCKIDALEDAKPRLPPGLFEAMQKALSRDPAARYPTATDFANALAPFEADPRLAVREISSRVKWVQSAQSTDQLAAVRGSVRAMRAARPAEGDSSAAPAGEAPAPPPLPTARTRSSTRPPAARAVADVVPSATRPPPPPEHEPKTERYEVVPSFVVTEAGVRFGPWTFARLMEALATGQIARSDQVDFVGRGFRAAEEVEELARFFPAQTVTTSQLTGPGTPDVLDLISPASMLQTLMRVLGHREAGVLFAERSAAGGRAGGPPSKSGRKELYFVSGKLHHVASSNASELLGEYLVRRGKLEREELDLALAVLPRYGGRMGDTLISMGLVGPVDIFRAIRDQGRDRVADLFTWSGGTLSFYRGHAAPHVEFPLDLELPALMLAGLEAAEPGDAPLAPLAASMDRVVAPGVGGDDHFTLEGVVWPPVVERVRQMLTRPRQLREMLAVAGAAGLEAADVVRALRILVAAGLARWA